MSKQHKPPERLPEGRSDRALDPLTHESTESNAVVGERIAGAPDAGWAEVRDTALPVVERAMLALQIPFREPAQVGRFVEIIEKSHLSDDRKAEVIDRLRSDDLAARGVSDALQRWFGNDNEAVRGEALDALGRVYRTLQGGDVVEAGEGTLGARSEAAIAAVAAREASGASPPGPEAGGAVRNFCRDVQLALLWDEEEDEDEAVAAELAE
jgi:hypothetical protein